MRIRGLLTVACGIPARIQLPAAIATAVVFLAQPSSAANPFLPVSLTFVVTVCLDEVEYSIACRSRGSLEVQHRIEQILLDNYTNGNTAGDLRVGFWVEVDSDDQDRFLREVETRAIEAVTSKLQTIHSGSYQLIRAWHDAAHLEAVVGRNWRHNWSERTHQYQIGPSRYQLARIRGG
jgi:hypothetical protein